MKNKFVAKQEGQRLDKIILIKFPQYSRAFIKEQIKLGNILIGGKKVKPSYILREGDAVAFAPSFIAPTTTEIQPNPDIKLNIIYEDENVIVLNKPAGLSVHPRQTKTGAPLTKELNNTLVSGLLAHYPPLADVGDNPTQPPLNLRGGEVPPKAGRGGVIPKIRPGIVHRLDKDTSGIMIVAKNQKSFNWLKKQFQERKVQKKYLALAHGSLKNKEGKIKTLLRRSISDPTKQKVISHESLLPSDEGRVGWGAEKIFNTTPSQSPPQLRGRGKIKEAITQYKVIKEFKNYSLLEMSPKTGRLHQIRVHLAHLGHPVAGDKKYGPSKRTCPSGLNRQFLHAQELKIILPEGNKKTFSAPLPLDLTTVIEKLEKK